MSIGSPAPMVPIGKSLTQVLATVKSGKSMLINITWLPFAALIALQYLTLFEHGQPFLLFQRVDITMNTLKAMCGAIVFLGISRWLLNESRFRVRRITIKRDLETNVATCSIKFFWEFNIPFILIASVFLAFYLLDHFGNYLLISQEARSNDYSFLRTWTLVWKSLLFFLQTQLCLLLPSLAVSRHSTLASTFRCLISLRGNRIRVLVIQILLALVVGSVQVVASFAVWQLCSLRSVCSELFIIVIYQSVILATWLAHLVLLSVFCVNVYNILVNSNRVQVQNERL
jgi:hypothetical protein